MKRIAFFVEGQTEQIFVNRLVRYILGPKNANIIQRKIKGGTNVPKQQLVRHINIAKNPDFEVLIIDCGADNRVKSEMLENLENLENNDYQYLVGLRDLYPLPLPELNSLYRGLQFLPLRLRKHNCCFHIVVAVREIETWILAESTHFQKLNKRLTPQFIQQEMGFNPERINPVEREHPAEDINNIYKLVGLSYTKKKGQATRIIQLLDIKLLMGPLRKKLKGLDQLIGIIEQFRNSVDDDKLNFDR